MLALILLLCTSLVLGQQVGTLQAESHPPLSFQHCTKSGCTQQQGGVVLDANWRWAHSISGSTNCYTGNAWDTTLCPDPQTCASNCAIDGADYTGTYGINSDGTTVSLTLVTDGPYSTNIGSRVYLMASDSQYQEFKLLNQEFSFDVDVSQLPCGLNGAVYFVSMDADGGMAKFPTNLAGAKYGTGYCDAQCPHDMKWIDGQANTDNWEPSPDDPNSGSGMYGTCCTEMDIWEANSVSAAFTPHVCSVSGQYRCSGTQCGDDPNNRYGGVCDKDGCDFNSFRMGEKNFYGPSLTVDTTKPFTIVTQFITSDNTSTGALSQIARLYVQNGRVIYNSAANFSNFKPYTSISDQFCNDQKTLFGDKNMFESLGGLKSMGNALNTGMVLTMSLWDDYDAHMLWLDSDYPVNGSTSQPGISRGTCATTSGVPSYVQQNYPSATVKYGNIKYGDIGTTY